MSSHDKAVQPATGAGPATFFHTLPTFKADGLPSYRSRGARDLAYLLEVDSSVSWWTTSTPDLMVVGSSYRTDFLLCDMEGVLSLMDAPDRSREVPTQDISIAAGERGFEYRTAERRDVYHGFRLRNARDLLRYANYSPSLGDRLRLFAALDDQGPLRMSDCVEAVAGRDPVAAVAVLILQGHLEIDLDTALIGPETAVSRIRN